MPQVEWGQIGLTAIARRFCSRFLRTLFEFSKRTTGEAAKFGSRKVERLGVVGAARFESGEPAAKAGELVRRQLDNSFGDFFDFHAAQYSTAGSWLTSALAPKADQISQRTK